jgi:outer membrane autotransporter protein
MDKTKILKTFLITIFLACNIGLNFAKAADIGNETVNTSTLTANDAITFTSSLGGILNYNTDAIDTLSSISTENDGVGTLQLSDFFEILVINGDIGSATKKINNISFLSYSPLDVNGSIYANSITSGDNYFGILSLYGANSSIQTSIGDATYAIGEINVSAENVSFYEDIYATGFNINSSNSAIIYGTTNVIEDFTMYSSSTLTIDSASQIEITDSATLDDTLNLGILSTSSSDVIIDGTGTANITITDGSSLYFDYADATNISTADTYAFIDNFDGGITVTASNLVVTDNSILLKSSVIADSNSLSLTTSIDSSTTSRLSSRNLSNLNSIFASSNSSLQLSLFKLSTQSTLDDALTSLRIESNNMVQMASFDITNQIDNIIDTRTQSINSHNVNKTIGAITASEDANNKTGSWGSVFGNRTIQGKLEGEEGYKSNTGGVVFGFDKVEKIKNYNSIIGGTFAYSNAVTRSDSVSNQKVSIDSYQFSLYNHMQILRAWVFIASIPQIFPTTNMTH